MIEQGLFKNHFVGRDGFQWWIGQVPDSDSWSANLPDKTVAGNSDPDYKGYSERYKVRIMGYHTANKEELPDDDLPWATLMYPVTAGGGSAGHSQTSNIVQGTFVYGFFLDGEDGQQPVIMGCIGYNDYQSVMKNVPDVGFVPFRGVKPDVPVGAAIRPLSKATETTGTVTTTVDGQQVKTAAAVNGNEMLSPEAPITTESESTNDAAKEKTEVLAQPKTCEKLPVGRIQQSIRNLIYDVEQAKKGLYNFEKGAIQELADKEQWINEKIEFYAEQIAGGLKSIYTEIEKFVEDKVNEALKFAYDIAFPNERAAVKSTSKTILDTISCFFRKLIGQLVQLMTKFLADVVDRVINVSKCFVDNFIGGIFGMLGGIIEGLFSGLTSLISGAVDIGGEALDLGSDVLGMVDQLLSFLTCDDRPECSTVNEWNIITGGNQINKGDITDIVDRAKNLFQETQNVGLQALDNVDMVTDIQISQLFNLEDSCNIREVLCGAPILEFFGSNGVGAAGNLIIGAAGDIIGVDMLSFGNGYDADVEAKVIDICGRGSGAVLRPVFGRIPTDGSPIGGAGGGTPATAPPNIGFGPFGPQNYPFPGGPGPSLSPVPLGPVSNNTPLYGVGPTGFGDQAPLECIDTEFTVTRAAALSNVFTFRLVDADPEFLTGWDYTGDDVSGGETEGGTTYIECVVPGVDYLVQAFLPDGTPCPNPLKIDAGGSTVRMDDAWDGGVEIINEDVEVGNIIDGVNFTVTTDAQYANRVIISGLDVNVGKEFDGNQLNENISRSVQVGVVYDIQIISPESRESDGGTRIRGGGNRFEVEEARDSDWTDVIMTASQGRFFDLVSNADGNSTIATAKYVIDGSSTKIVTQQVERSIGYVSDGDYLDLVVTAGVGKFRNVKNNTCLYRRDGETPPDGPGEAVAPPQIGVPTIPDILIPAPAPDGEIGIVDVIVVQPGAGYLPGPDGSKGGDGRTWANPDDTIVVRDDGRIETPIPPGNYFCVKAGDTVELPPGTVAVTETNGGVGGGERIIGGAPYIMRNPGCFTTPEGGERKDEGGYPVLLYLCDIIVDAPGFGYEPNDPVIIKPSRGAEATLKVDKFGRVIGVNVIQAGEGFKEMPTITIDSDNGYNAKLIAKLCIDKDVEFEDPEKVVQVVDCVGKF
tara:strand:+ start:1857 stop:5312 length:3456 start_codon:yes stop_codon:yes gene_type:complete